MSRQFNRFFELTVTTQPETLVSIPAIDILSGEPAIKVTDLKVTFEVTKDLLGYPNLAKINVYNLSEKSRGAILNTFDQATGKSGSKVVLKAGYQTQVPFINIPRQIFSGDLRYHNSLRDGTDNILELWAGDGEQAINQGFFSKAYDIKASVKTIIDDILDTFNLTKGKIEGIDTIADKLNGILFADDSRKVLTELCTENGLIWSVQDGVISVMPKNQANTDIPIVVINRETGMVGSPSITEIGADVQTLLNPEIVPGGLVKIESEFTSLKIGNLFFRAVKKNLGVGIFRVNKVIHTGDTRGNQWYSTITGAHLTSGL